MENSLFKSVYNPDVLSCIANLSNDEVFTPPELANKIIDMLPQELFENPDTTFLDPCCKSGVFLREIAKRLIKGLERQIPDLEKRIEHIFSKQLFGVAITELTSLLSRRSVYCSKFPSSEFSAYQFPEDKPQGNIIYQRIKVERPKSTSFVQPEPVRPATPSTPTSSAAPNKAEIDLKAQLEALAVDSTVLHKKFGKGTVIKINKNEKFIHIKFTLGEKKFIFPDAFLMGFLEIE